MAPRETSPTIYFSLTGDDDDTGNPVQDTASDDDDDDSDHDSGYMEEDEDQHDEDEDHHPIFEAIDNDDVEAVTFYMQSEARVLFRRHDETDETPLGYAVFSHKPDLALFIIENGLYQDFDAAPRCGEWKGTTALNMACWRGYVLIVKKLVEKGANPSKAAQEPYGGPWFPLTHAVDARHYEIVEFLLQFPSVRQNINVQAPSGRTVLGMACDDEDNGIIRLLLDAGADPEFPPGMHSPMNIILRNLDITEEHKAKIAPNLAIIQAAIEASTLIQ